MTEMSEMSEMASFDDVRAVVGQTLGVGERSAGWTPSTELFGSVPELDSLAVVEVLAALEDRFGVMIDGEDLSIDAFATFGSLYEFVVAMQRVATGDVTAGR